MFVLGITGGIGCGKSTVAAICRDAGLPVIDADELSRQVTAAGGAALTELRELFGPSVLDEQGALNRQRMARLVFSDRNKLDQLSAVIHRHVLDTMRAEVEKLREKKQRAVVLDVPIPVKHGFLDLCDQVWVVWSSDEVRIARLNRRGMGEEEARRRMAMQMSRDEYIALADHVIENDSSLDALRASVEALLIQELKERGVRIRIAGEQDA
ncbi:MAG: dephospho-CoA kinase [Ruminococcaceae bacterium]|jgi:dephospho-CoA kinase|nr:dephospho-CoA kinase [Oscillospiraceae bacterium]